MARSDGRDALSSRPDALLPNKAMTRKTERGIADDKVDADFGRAPLGPSCMSAYGIIWFLITASTQIRTASSSTGHRTAQGSPGFARAHAISVFVPCDAGGSECDRVTDRSRYNLHTYGPIVR